MKTRLTVKEHFGKEAIWALFVVNFIEIASFILFPQKPTLEPKSLFFYKSPTPFMVVHIFVSSFYLTSFMVVQAPLLPWGVFPFMMEHSSIINFLHPLVRGACTAIKEVLNIYKGLLS